MKIPALVLEDGRCVCVEVTIMPSVAEVEQANNVARQTEPIIYDEGPGAARG